MDKIDIYVKNLNSRPDRIEKINTIFNNCVLLNSILLNYHNIVLSNKEL